MKNPYSPVYMTCIEEAKKDLRAKARPELVSMTESIDETDDYCLMHMTGVRQSKENFSEGPPWRHI